MSNLDPNRRPSSAGRYLFLLLLGLVLGAIGTVMALRAIEARKDQFPEALMHVQQWHMGQLKANMEQNRCNATDVLPHLQAKRVKVLGVTTAKRSPQVPDYMSAQEAGVPGVDASIWVGLFAPKGTPAPVIARTPPSPTGCGLSATTSAAVSDATPAAAA